MRTYSKDYKNHPRTTPYTTNKERANREAKEWDIRIDITPDCTLDYIVQTIKDSITTGDIVYTLISGLENPDETNSAYEKSLSQQTHVHIALVMLFEINRATALKICRGAKKLSDEYCVPRNQKFTYAGWVAHHTKINTKHDPDNLIEYEYGTLPMDALNEETCWKVVKMLKKFGTNDIKARFDIYYKHLDKIKNDKIAEENNEAVDDSYVLPSGTRRIPKHLADLLINKE
jgi:phosphopantothenoylcysteine synthetase/decarboxylase